MFRALLILLALSADASDPPIILGALEEIHGRYVDEPPHRAVRVAFQKKGAEWQSFPTQCAEPSCLKTIASEYPHTVTWTITRSGRSLGQVTAATPKGYELYSAVGLQNITSKRPVPAQDTPILRPLIVNSQPYFKDPDSWKPSHPSPEVTAAARLAFRKKFPETSNCTSRDPENPKSWQYRDADMKFNKAYSSIHNWSVVEILLAGNRCIAVPDDAFVSQWFAVTPSGEAIFLDQGMWLVDAGDYDNDGKSELVFAIDRANEGGYEIYYDDFQKHAAFQFSYH